MQQSILALFGVTLAASLAELLLPVDQAKGPSFTMRLMVALGVLLLLLQPFLKLVREGGEFPFPLPEEAPVEREDYERVFEETVKGESERDIVRGIRELLFREYGVCESEAEIRVSFSSGGEVECIRVFLAGGGLLQDPVCIEKDLEGRFGCEVEVR